MIPAVASALDLVVGNVVALRNARGAGRAYELYVMTGIAMQLRARGCKVWLQRSDGTPVLPGDTDRRFIQRGGAPTGVPGSAEGAGNASVIGFRHAGSSQAWEIWNGVQFTGRSGSHHELDIAVVPAEVGIALRLLPSGGVPGGRPAVSIECKDVGAKGSNDEMRAFVARMYDLTFLNWHQGKIPHLPMPLRRIHPGAPAGHGPFYSFWTGNRDTLSVVARRTGFVLGATTMSSYYAVQPRGPVYPGSAEDSALMDDVAQWIFDKLR